MDEPYQYFMRPEPHEDLGPIKLIDDEMLGKNTKTRTAKIGMVRNASNKQEVLVYLDPYPHIRIDKAKDLQGWYKGANEKSTVRPRPCYTEAILTEPYGGWCPLGCMACYINSGIRGYRGTGLVTVPINYGRQVRKQLSGFYRAASGYFTSFHDPFNCLEPFYHNTEQAAEAFVEVGLPIFFLSRLVYPDWAIALLQKNKYSYAQKSINTSNPDDWQKLSPGAPSLQEQYMNIRRLRTNGIYVSIQVNPIIPGVISNEDVINLFHDLSKAGANHVIVKFVEAGYSWAPTMIERMIKKFGDRGKRFAELFTQNIGGQRSVDEDYRIRVHKLYSSYAKRYGMTYSCCYEYKYERDETGNILGKAGVSLGPEFTTSAQCHGPAVPVYTRSSLKDKFSPIPECPPSGCLYCNEGNKGVSRCGNKIAGEAAALRLTHFRKPMK